MAGSDWALVVLVVYPLLQIPLVLYLARWFELDGDAPVVTPTRAYWSSQSTVPESVPATTDRPGRCRQCGTDNDPTYSFCRGCVTRL